MAEQASNVVQMQVRNESLVALRDLAATLTRQQIQDSVDESFGGKRNLYESFGYPKKVTSEALWRMFSRQNIARRIVVAPAASAWSNPPNVIFDSGAAQERWDSIVKNKRLALWYQLARLDVLCGLGEYAVLFISLGDSNPGTRARRRRVQRDPIMMIPYAQMAATIAELDGDIRSPNYGRPLLYNVNPNNAYQKNQSSGIQNINISGIGSLQPPSTGGSGSGDSINRSFQLHYTRAVHAAEEAFDNDLYGAPRLRPVFNDMLDILKVIGGAAETFWIAGNRGLHVDIDKELELKKGDAVQLKDEIDRYIHQLSRVIRTRGTKVTNLGSDSPNPREAFSALISLVCGATTLPRRILMGSEAGHLASEQDRANWADRMRERNELFCKPRVLYPTILRLQDLGVIPESDFEADWPDPFTLSPIERSQTFSNWSRGLASASSSIESGAIMATREEIREFAGLPPHEPDPGMGTLAEFDTAMFVPEENIQSSGRRDRTTNPGQESPPTNEDDNEDSQSSGQNPQTQRS